MDRKKRFNHCEVKPLLVSNRYRNSATGILFSTKKSRCLAKVLLALIPICQLTALHQCFATEYAFVVSTDYYSAAYYSTIEIEPPRQVRTNIGTVSIDPVVHYDYQENKVFVINRYLADNIQVIDPILGFATVAQYSVGNGSNPHDIRLASSQKAYVTRYEWKTLLMVNPYIGDSLGTIDLSCFADADGIPEMDRMEIVGKRLFVSLNIINHTTWLPDGPGKIAVIDVEADTIIDCDPYSQGIQPIILPFQNPITEMRYDPCSSKIVLGCMSVWGDLLGGVISIDPSDLTISTIITEDQLAGDIVDVLLTSDGKGYAIVLDPKPWPENYARLVAFDPVSGTVTDTLYVQSSGMGSSLGTLEANRQREIYLCDRDITNPCVRIYDTRHNSLITRIDVGVPPFDIEFVQVPWAGISDKVNRSMVVSPNPGSKQFTIRICNAIVDTNPYSNRLENITGSIYDPRGRKVREIDFAEEIDAVFVGIWDCRDSHGKEAAPGVYFLRVEPFDISTRLIMVR